MCQKCMKKRRNRVSGIMKKGTSTMIKNGVQVAAGYAGSRIVSNLPFVAANPFFRVIAPAAAGLLVSSFMGAKGAPIAAGMVAGSAVNVVQEYLPDVADKAGLSGPGVAYKSLYNAGVSGSSVMLG